jgi:hypothetical protein
VVGGMPMGEASLNTPCENPVRPHRLLKHSGADEALAQQRPANSVMHGGRSKRDTERASVGIRPGIRGCGWCCRRCWVNSKTICRVDESSRISVVRS